MADAISSQGDQLRPLPSPILIKGRFWSGFPRLLSPLIGRECEVASVVAHLRQPATRLLTLTGPGGVGKTRLAVAAATACAADFADGAAFVPLAAVRNPADVLVAIARTLGLRESPGRPMADAVVAALHGRAVLLVLDNFEHLLPATPIVMQLLEACPRLTVLATSRAALHLSCERRYTTLPLALPSGNHDVEALAAVGAIALFVERARWAEPAFALTDANAGAVSEICQRLDGLPLAIELAAAWMRVLTPAHLLARLEPRLPLLHGGAADLPDRFRTMRSAIAWSYDLLDGAEQHLLRQLACFVGGFTLASAEALVAELGSPESSSSVQRIAALIDKSLLQVTRDADRTRFQMLETVREFAAERLAEHGELEAVSAAHASVMATFALQAEPHVFGPDEATWQNRCTEELGNLRAAMVWSLAHDRSVALRIGGALWGFWASYHLPEGRRWLTAALSQDTDPHAPTQARALTTASALASLEGDYAEGLDLANRALALADQVGSPEEQALIHWMIGSAYLGIGDLEQAARNQDRALALFEDASTTTNRSWAAYARAYRGAVAFMLGDNEQGFAFYEGALDRARRAGSDSVLLLILGDYAGWLIQFGRTSAATALLEEALALAMRVGGLWMVGSPLIGLALLDAMAGNATRAARRLGAVHEAKTAWGLDLPAHIQQRIDEAAARSRSALGDDLYLATWAAGRSAVEQVVAEAIDQRDAGLLTPAGDPGDGHDLSRRQREVLALLVEGRSNRQIAEALFISPRTASHHVAAIMSALNARSRGEAAVRAVRAGLI